jgi:hypothetical protein
MIEDARQFPATETGQTLMGIEGLHYVVILDVIPDLLNITRAPGSLSIGGGTYQVEYYKWCKAHWEQKRANAETRQSFVHLDFNRALLTGMFPQELNQPLAVVGEWHKHPGNFRQLSGIDRGQIDRILHDQEQARPQFITPIVTYEEQPRLTFRYDGAALLGDISYTLHIDWYYTSRNVRRTQAVKIAIVPDASLPATPVLPWYLRDPHRMDEEINRLKDAGYSVNWKLKDVDNDDICELIFGIDHRDWNRRVILVLRYNYPISNPTIKLSQKSGRTIPVQQAMTQSAAAKQHKGDRLYQWIRNVFIGNETRMYHPNNWGREVFLIDRIRKIDGALRDEHLGQNRETSRQQSNPIA